LTIYKPVGKIPTGNGKSNRGVKTMTQTIPLIEAFNYTLVGDDIYIKVDTGDEERPCAEFVGRYDIVPIEEDRFSYSLSMHYTDIFGYWVEFDATKAYYVNDHGHELEEFIYGQEDIDTIEQYLTDEFEAHGGL
jgi:hypothetical protein